MDGTGTAPATGSRRLPDNCARVRVPRLHIPGHGTHAGELLRKPGGVYSGSDSQRHKADYELGGTDIFQRAADTRYESDKRVK